MRLLTLLLLAAALAAGQARYARLGEFQGSVEVQLTAADPWIPAERNLPLTESAWLRTGADAHLEIELDDGSEWRLGPDSQGEISDYTRLSTGQCITLLSLDHGTAYFSGQPASKDVTMIVMPGAQVTITQGSRIRQTVQSTWSQVAVFEGLVRFSSPAAEMDLHEVTTARVEPANPSRFFLYPEVTGEPLDRWNEDRDKLQAAPASAAHVTTRFGLSDLDSSGQWISTDDLGLVWKPHVAEGWVPYRNGRWRYFESLGYTWVSDDSWGWLPYHNGRWAQKANLGWVWQPSVSRIFHPGEVYWQRGGAFVGWGPLAPGENWTTPNGPALAYTSGATTYAAFQPEMRLIASTGFPTPVAELLKAATFVAALPSPTFLTSRLDATRPTLKAGRTRVIPSVYGVTFGDGPPPDSSQDTPVITGNDAPPPALADAAAGAVPPPDAVYTLPITPVVEVPVPVPVPVAVDRPAATATVPKSPAPGPSRGPRSEPVRPDPNRKPGITTPEEQELYRLVLEDINPTAPNFVKALADLNTWSRKFPNAAALNDREYYYIHVYNSTGHPDKVLDAAEPLLEEGVAKSFRDQQQILQILVAASSSVQKLAPPTQRQLQLGQQAARQLLEFIPEYFDPSHKPAGVTDASWSIARSQLEAVAKQALARRPAGRTGVR